MGYEILILFLLIVVVVYLLGKLFRRVTIFEYERGLKYEKGKYVKLLDAGSYWHNTYHTTISKVDIRPRYQTIPSQEVLSKDGIAIKLSLAANIEVVQADVAVNSVNNYEEAFYLVLQLALRTVIGTTQIDKLLEKRNQLGKEIFAIANKKNRTTWYKTYINRC